MLWAVKCEVSSGEMYGYSWFGGSSGCIWKHPELLTYNAYILTPILDTLASTWLVFLASLGLHVVYVPGKRQLQHCLAALHMDYWLLWRPSIGFEQCRTFLPLTCWHGCPPLWNEVAMSVTAGFCHAWLVWPLGVVWDLTECRRAESGAGCQDCRLTLVESLCWVTSSRKISGTQ
jgi:hypothetical protein